MNRSTMSRRAGILAAVIGLGTPCAWLVLAASPQAGAPRRAIPIDVENDLTRAIPGHGLLLMGQRTAMGTGGPDYATGFENPPFVLGPIGGQDGWTQLAASMAEGHVDSANPASGAQHLRVSRDPAVASQIAEIGARSPDVGPLSNVKATISVDVAIGALLGGTYEITPQAPSQGFVVTRMQFHRVGDIRVLVDGDGDGDTEFVDTTFNWTPGAYVNVTIEVDPCAGTIVFKYGATVVYTATSVPLANAVEQVVFLRTNTNSAEHGDFDNLVHSTGLACPGACCHLAGEGTCEILLPEECAQTPGVYMGNSSICDDCIPTACGVKGSGNCLNPNGLPNPGCEDAECCAAVCELDSSCCSLQWDDICAATATDLPACQPPIECGSPGTGSCFEVHGTPFCDDGPCCETVCQVDPFCCETEWDGLCVGEADDLCGCTPGSQPANDLCESAVPLPGLGSYEVTNECATPGQPSHASCNDGFVVGLGLDVWYTFTVPADYPSDILVVSTCNMTDGAWDTQLAVYATCECSSLEDPPLGCSDDGPGCGGGSSLAVVPVVPNNCYMIRLGGTYLGSSGTATLELSDELPSCCPVIQGGATEEPEVCFEDLNGGCNNLDDVPPLPPTFTPIECDDVIYGHAYGDGGTRDTDWYELIVPAGDCQNVCEDTCATANNGMCDDGGPDAVTADCDLGTDCADCDPRCAKEVTLTIDAEFAFVMGVIENLPQGSGDCADNTDFIDPAITGPSCLESSMMVNLIAPGTHWLFVATNSFDGTLCGSVCDPETLSFVENDYLFSLTCGPQCPTCVGDFNESGTVNASDLALLLGAWGAGCSQANGCCMDINGSGNVNASDLALLLGNWGPC